MSITYANVTAVNADMTAPNYGRNADGYGRKIPTRYRVIVDWDGRWRRVYAVCFSNAASFYVVVNGADLYLNDHDLM